MTSIGQSAFDGCENLASVTIYKKSPITIGPLGFPTRSNITLYVPKGSKAAYEAADYWKEFKEIVEMEDPGPAIDFACGAVKALCIANWDTNHDGELSRAEAAAVTDLGDVFKGNKEITSFDELRYFTGVKNLDRAFNTCTELLSLTIPANVEELVPSHDLDALVSLKVDENNTKYDSRNDCNAIIETATNKLVSGCRTTVTPDDVIIIGSFAFAGRWGLQTINIPTSVKVIEAGAFPYCISLRSIKLPPSLERIEGGDVGAFDFSALQYVSIPSSVTFIGENAFVWCQQLKSVKVGWEQPLAVPANTFANTPLENVTLYVPAGTMDAYASAEVWRDFGNIVETGVGVPDIQNSVYYLRNVETGKYLSKGNSWGMHAVLSNAEEALPVEICKRGDNYALYCPERSQFTQYIFRANESEVYVDYNGQNDGSPLWTFTEQGKDVYYIQTEVGHSAYGQEPMPGTCLGNNPNKEAYDEGGNALGRYNDVDGNVNMNEHRNNVLWQLELARKTGAQHERLEELANKLAPLGVNVDWAREILKWDEADYFDAMREIDRLEKETGRIDQLKDELRNMIASAGKIDVNTNEASSVADNEGATIDEIRGAITNLRSAFIAKLGEGVDESLLPLDVTGVIINPSFTCDDAEGWEGDEPGLAPQKFCNNAEFYERSFDFHQTINGLPNGNYKLEVQRFKRGVDDEHVHYYANDRLCNVSDVFEEALDWKPLESWWENVFPDFREYDEDGVKKYAPNSMIGARAAFDLRLYDSWLPFEVTDGTATIGIKVDTEEGERWVCFDNFRLTYYGSEPVVPEVSNIAEMENAVYIEPFSANVGSNVNIEVKLKNAETTTSYGFELKLPEGITITTDGDGSFDESIILSSRNSKHNITTNKLDGNIYKVGVASLSSKSITDNDGLVLTIKAHVQEDMAEGLYQVAMYNPLIVYTNGVKPSVQKTYTTVTVENYQKGDVDGDGVVDLADAVLVINHYVGKPVTTFIEKAADVDGDGVVDLADAVLIINYYVGKIPSLSRSVNENGLDPQ